MISDKILEYNANDTWKHSTLSYMDPIFSESFMKRGYKIKINFLLEAPRIYPDENFAPVPEILEEPDYTDIALKNLKKLALKIGSEYSLIQGPLYDEGPDTLPYVGIMQYQPVYDDYIPEYIPPLDYDRMPVYDIEPRKEEFSDPYVHTPVYGDEPLPFAFADPYIRFEPIYDLSPEPYYGHLAVYNEPIYDMGPEYITYTDPYYRTEYLPVYDKEPELFGFEDPFTLHYFEPVYDLSPRASDFVDPFIMEAIYGEAPEPVILPKYKVSSTPIYDKDPEPYYQDMWRMAHEPMYDFGPEQISFTDPYLTLMGIPEYDPPIEIPLGFDPYATARDPYYDEGPEPLPLNLLKLYEPVYDLGPEWVPAPYIEHIPVYDKSPVLELLPEHIPIYGEQPSFKIKLTSRQYEDVIARYGSLLKRLNSHIIPL